MINYNGYILSDKLGRLRAKQTGLFTPAHVKHYLTITITNSDGVKSIYKTTFQFSPAAVKYKNGDGLAAVIMDATAAADADNVGDFARLFGYDNAAAARPAFNACRRALDFFTRAGLTTDDLQKISDILEG